MRRRATGLLLLGVLVLMTLPLLGALGSGGQPADNPSESAYHLVSPGHHSSTVTAQQEGGEPEANLPFLFAVYAITWLAFFAYAFYMSRRQADLRREVQALRQELEARGHPPGQ